MDRDEVQRIIGRLRFGDPEQIRVKRLLEGEDAGSVAERVEAWLNDSLLRVNGCPPEVLSAWACGLDQAARAEARMKVEALRTLVLAMDLFLEEASRASDTK